MKERIGNCKIIGEIGSGGMADVYKAIQEPLGRVVAIKSLKKGILYSQPEIIERFEREAKILASMQHEHIVNVYDLIVEEDARYIIMEYVDGIDLYELIGKVGKLPVEVASIIIMQVASALEYAHFKGIIHMDIKPANIMISKQGEVKLMDFGIAKYDEVRNEKEGYWTGTPSYMSPEQIVSDKVDHRSDIFSLGVVYYQMVTGQKPFMDDENRTVLQKIRLEKYPSIKRFVPNVPREIEKIIGKCLEKLPANRYQTMYSLIRDLESFLSKRIEINYKLYLINYLASKKIITNEEKESIFNISGNRLVVKKGILFFPNLSMGFLCSLILNLILIITLIFTILLQQ